MNVDRKMDQLLQNRIMIANCEKFNLRHTVRQTINDFFDELRHHLDDLQRKKMNEINKILKETNFINVQLRAKELDSRADACENYFLKK
jgi:predicted solute-binding protein